MKKRFWSIATTAAASLLIALGFGSCHSNKKALEAAERERQQAELERERALQLKLQDDSIRQVIERQRVEKMKREAEMHKVVYGPPPAPYVKDITE